MKENRTRNNKKTKPNVMEKTYSRMICTRKKNKKREKNKLNEKINSFCFVRILHGTDGSLHF